MRGGSPLILHHNLASLPHPRRCDALFRIVLNLIAYLSYRKLPSESAVLLLLYPSHFLNDVFTRPAFGLDLMIAAAIKRNLWEVAKPRQQEKPRGQLDPRRRKPFQASHLLRPIVLAPARSCSLDAPLLLPLKRPCLLS